LEPLVGRTENDALGTMWGLNANQEGTFTELNHRNPSATQKLGGRGKESKKKKDLPTRRIDCIKSPWLSIVAKD